MQPAMLVYKAPRKSLYLSVAAAQVLLDKSIISPDDLDLYGMLLLQIWLELYHE
jgi:hypothetical protein